MKLQTSLFMVVLYTQGASGSAVSYPRAQNVTWISTNFKTLLTWEPKPSDDYSYTVEFSVAGGDQQRNLHCIRSNATVCDLSVYLHPLDSCYTADVLSEPPLGTTSDDTEFPIPPHPDSALTKTKTYQSKSSVIEMTDLDKGESYCFNVQAYIPIRSAGKQLGELSATKCSNNDEQSIFKVYSPAVFAGGILFILLVIGLLTLVTVILWKKKRKALKSGTEGRPLRDV